MHTSFALGFTPDKQKNKALGIATGKSNELHVILTNQENPDFPCVFLRANSAVINRRPRANACYVKLLLITVTFFFFTSVQKKAPKAMQRDGLKSVVGERQLFCDSQKKSGIRKN